MPHRLGRILTGSELEQHADALAESDDNLVFDEHIAYDCSA